MQGAGGKEGRQVYYIRELAKADCYTRGNSIYSLGVQPPGGASPDSRVASKRPAGQSGQTQRFSVLRVSNFK